MVLALSVLFLSAAPPLWIRGAGAGAGAAVAAVAVRAALGLAGPSRSRIGKERARRVRWFLYLLAGGASAAVIGPYLVLVLLGTGAVELLIERRGASLDSHLGPLAVLLPAAVAEGGLGALAWTALKVGALSFGGGFVIIPLMQGDAVHVYHWMTNSQFLNAVALGQVTPGRWSPRSPRSAMPLRASGAACWPPPSPSPRRSRSSPPGWALRAPPRELECPGLPRRRRAGGDRRHLRCSDSPCRRPE